MRGIGPADYSTGYRSLPRSVEFNGLRDARRARCVYAHLDVDR